jgi:hypothetical protein
MTRPAKAPRRRAGRRPKDVVPLAGAALIPFAIAGATKLPYKEVFTLVRKLLIL